MTHLDSSFLIDLLRETSRRQLGRATAFLESLRPEEPLAVSVHVLCELMAGAELSERPSRETEAITRLCQGLHVACPDQRFAPAYGKLLASIRRTGRTVATMDLLIATAAILDDARLVTRNVKDFAQLPGLSVVPY